MSSPSGGGAASFSSSPGLIRGHYVHAVPVSPRGTQILDAVASLAETIAEEAGARVELAARVGALEAENAGLRAMVVALAARVDSLLPPREAERSPLRAAARSAARHSTPPVRTL